MKKFESLGELADACRDKKMEAKEANCRIATWIYGKYEEVCRKKIMSQAMKEISKR